MTANDTGLVMKKKALRHNEYYATQQVFDNLYALSKNGCKFTNLIVFTQSKWPKMNHETWPFQMIAKRGILITEK